MNGCSSSWLVSSCQGSSRASRWYSSAIYIRHCSTRASSVIFVKRGTEPDIRWQIHLICIHSCYMKYSRLFSPTVYLAIYSPSRWYSVLSSQRSSFHTWGSPENGPIARTGEWCICPIELTAQGRLHVEMTDSSRSISDYGYSVQNTGLTSISRTVSRRGWTTPPNPATRSTLNRTVTASPVHGG